MLFDRVYRLLVGRRGETRGIEIAGLRITFDIRKTTRKSPNKSNIRIWNLREATRAELEKPDTRCVFSAGYAEDAGPLLMFQGGVTFAWSKREGPDIITEFELGDGTQEMRDTAISVGYAGNIKSTQIINDVSRQMGLPLTLPSNAPEREWQHGFSYYGNATGILDKVTQATGLEWSVQNETLQVIERGMVTTRQGIELAVDSGLVESPERDRKSQKGHKQRGTVKSEYDGWRVKSLLMPMLNPGDRFKLTSRFVDGVFRIEDVRHHGDSHGGDWMSEFKVIDPAKPISGQTATKGGEPGRGRSRPDVNITYVDAA